MLIKWAGHPICQLPPNVLSYYSPILMYLVGLLGIADFGCRMLLRYLTFLLSVKYVLKSCSQLAPFIFNILTDGSLR